MKKAILVTFEIKTRVIVDADYDNATLANLDWEVAKIAADKLKSYPNAYIDEGNMTEVAIDMEDPYDPDYDTVDLHIPSSEEIIDYIIKKDMVENCKGSHVWMPALVLDKRTYIDSLMIGNNNQLKIHYCNPDLENVGISLVDWNDVSIEVKLKIMKAIGYED